MSIVAPGGVGKSALVWGWLQGMQRERWRGAERVYGWSFYTQGATDGPTSAETFITDGLRWFGDANPNLGSPWEKGERLANLIRDRRTLLVLDGVEPLQWGMGPEVERLKDPALATLVRELGTQDSGLCVITSRIPVREVEDFPSNRSRRLDLRTLSDEAGGRLLRARGVTGTDEELHEAVREYGGHSLALALLGSYLYEVAGGDVRRRNEIGPLMDEERLGNHAQRVMAAYERMFGHTSPEVGVLRMLGLFDRPAREGEIDALKAEPVITGLTDAVVGIQPQKWSKALARLQRVGLVEIGTTTEERELDAHPLVREYFGEQLRQEQKKAWQEGNRRLYEHLKRTAKPLPETVEEMHPLYEAVVHGCRAGKHQEARRDVHRDRIRRGNQHFSTRKLGAFNSEVAVLSAFFDAPWGQIAAELGEADQAIVFGMAGSALRALGRLREALALFRLCLERRMAQKAWKSAASAASNVSEVLQLRGELGEALKQARMSVKLADDSDDMRRGISSRTTIAAALHAMGHVKEAAMMFEEAEQMQAERRSDSPMLHSVHGFRYCDFLLDQGRGADAQRRATHMLDIAVRSNLLLEIALGNLSLGRAHILAVQRRTGGDLDTAGSYIKAAVDSFRRASQQQYLPLALLARAALHTYTRAFEQARHHLDEALSLAERCGFRLHECDACLGFGRLCIAEGDPMAARDYLERARAIIKETGYRRRDAEFARLEAQATVAPRQATPSALDATPVIARAYGPESRFEPEVLFAWAHIADTQFRDAGGPVDRRSMLNRLRLDIAGAVARGCPKLDAILVTGNVAFSGGESEYAEAADWLAGVAADAGVAKGSIYVVPGNHDVEWRAGDRDVWRLLLNLRSGAETLDDALVHDRRLLTQRLTRYQTFAGSFAPACGALFWVQKIVADTGLHVRFVGLNTALLCAPREDDRGKLRIGSAQLASGLDDLRSDELVVILSHHPFRDGWLTDETNADAWVTNNAHVHLFAHGREQAITSANRTFVRVSSGVTYTSDPGKDRHGYNVAAVVRAPDGAISLRIWPRSWSERRKIFQTDVDSLQADAQYAEHRLGLPPMGPRSARPWDATRLASPQVQQHAPATIFPLAPSAMSTQSGVVDFGIVIALPEELRTFLDLTPGYTPTRTAALDSYIFTRAGYRCAVILVGDMGETAAGAATERLIEAFNPGIIVSIGITGSVHDDLRAGDVYIPSQAVEYSQDAKARPTEDGGFSIVPGAPAYRADFTLLHAVRNFELTHGPEYDRWMRDCSADLLHLLPHATHRQSLVRSGFLRGKAMLLTDGHVATGPVVGAAPAFADWIRSHDRHVKAIEMESAAVLLAAQTRSQPKRALMIRGIADKSNANKANLDQLGDGALRLYAMRNAVRLLWALLDAKAFPPASR